MTRLLYYNSGSIGILNNSHNLEVICEAMYTHEIDIASLEETNTHWNYDKSLPKLKQVLKQFWSRTNISTSEQTGCVSNHFLTEYCVISYKHRRRRRRIRTLVICDLRRQEQEESYNNISLSNLISNDNQGVSMTHSQ